MNPLMRTDYFTLLAALVLLGTGLTVWRSTSRVRWLPRTAMVLLRLAAVSGLLILFLNLGRWTEQVESTTGGWAVMVDHSASMATQDVPDELGDSRWTAACRLAQGAVRHTTDPDSVTLYAFARDVQVVDADALDRLAPDGDDTRLVACGRDVLARERSRGRSLRGILLLSDGRAPVSVPLEAFALRAAARGTPLYPVPLGGVVPPRDLSLTVRRRRFVSFLDQPVTLGATLLNDRMGSAQSTLTLRDGTGTVLEEQTLFTTNGQTVPIRFEVQPDGAGYHEYTISTPAREGETDQANNEVGLGVFVLSDSLHVLLVEGEPYWDTKFLSHLLRGQTNMSVTAIFRIAQDRYFRVSDQSALAAASSETFPATDEEMAAFDLVVFGRGSEYLIDEERAARLRTFLSEHGGCVLFARGKSYQTLSSPLADLEPVVWGDRIQSHFELHPLLAGEQVGLFGGVLPARNDTLWRALPPLERANQCQSLKSFASVLAEGIPRGHGGEPFPAMVSRRYGRGLVLLVNGDGLWRWGFTSEQDRNEEVYRNLWIRLFQWVVSFAEFNPGADFAVGTDSGTTRVGSPLRVQVTSRAVGAPTAPRVVVYRGEERLQIIVPAPDDRDPNRWLGVVVLSEPGVYRLALEDEQGTDLKAQTSIHVLAEPGEGDELSADLSALRQLAEVSGGRLLRPDEITELVDQLEKPVTAERRGDIIWDPAWDNPWFGLTLLLCFAVEWYLRRRQGLP